MAATFLASLVARLRARWLADRVRFELRPGLPACFTPERATTGSAGYDLRACLPEPHAQIELRPGARVLLATGVRALFAPGWRGVTFDRSSFRSAGLSQLGPGVIDSDYTGEIRVVIHNLGPLPVKIAHGDKIAQLVLERMHTRGDLPAAARVNGDAGGFGSTGDPYRAGAGARSRTRRRSGVHERVLRDAATQAGLVLGQVAPGKADPC